jgi:NAD(P)-dependent dehydrogenase (short-subunit alcohol dehydrogenase family)
MLKKFDQKTALVTGGSLGIGRAVALAFANEGANVVIADILPDEAGEVVDIIKKSGGEAVFQECDVSKSADVIAAVNTAVDRFGRLDFACNNAGIGGASAPTAEYTENDWQKVIDINLTGVWLCMKYEIQAMVKQGGGAIVNIASILGQVGFANAPAYVAAKHGVLGLTKTAALEYATQGIRINAICPGFIYTPMLEKGGIKEGTQMYDMIAGMHAQKRLGNVEEVAGAVVWLCSNQASFITGSALVVDGGYLAQ